MGRFVNFILGVLIIALGINYWFNFLSLIPVPYLEYAGTFGVILIGVLIFLSRKENIMGQVRSNWKVTLIGLLITSIGIVQTLESFGFGFLPISGTILSVSLIAAGAILILWAAPNWNKNFSLATGGGAGGNYPPLRW